MRPGAFSEYFRANMNLTMKISLQGLEKNNIFTTNQKYSQHSRPNVSSARSRSKVYTAKSCPVHLHQSSQTACLAFSFSSSALLASSFSLSLLFLSASLAIRSYSLSASVRLGALTPSPAAISRDAVAVVFSGLLSDRPVEVDLPDTFGLPSAGLYDDVARVRPEDEAGGGVGGGDEFVDVDLVRCEKRSCESRSE